MTEEGYYWIKFKDGGEPIIGHHDGTPLWPWSIISCDAPIRDHEIIILRRIKDYDKKESNMGEI